MLVKNKKNLLKKMLVLTMAIFLLSVIFETSSATNVQEVWHKQEDRGHRDRAYGVVTDSHNNVIITGESSVQFFTIKYDENATFLWEHKGFTGCGRGVTVDHDDNIIVTGGSGDYFTIKYDENGTELWNTTYDSSGLDYAYGVTVDSENNIIIVGQSQDNYLTIKYNSNGALIWNVTFDSGGFDAAYGIAVDFNDNILVTGESLGNYFTIKYDSDGNQLWATSYDGGDLDRAWAVDSDSTNNVIVTGETYITTYDRMFYTIKYDSSGTELWNVTPDTGGWDCSASSVVVDAYDNIIVFGTIYIDCGLNANYYTIKYDTNANQLWVVSYDSQNTDIGRGNTVDSLSNVIVTGQVKRGSSNWDYYTIKYNEPPIANFTYEPLVPTTNDTIQFNDTSFDPAGEITDWSWTLGDGNTSALQNPTHQYADDGTYTVTLTVWDDDGATDTTSKQITVLNVPPTADFTYTPINPDTSDLIQFTDNSTDSDGAVVSWSWIFGD
ncbi:PDK repeat-containing protein, partial [Thermoplasmatales archaeon SCGC AB-539-N05]